MAGKAGMRRYPLELRQEIVRKHLEEGVTLPKLCEEYGLNRTQVKTWCRWQRQYGIPKQMTGKKCGRPKTSERPETIEQRLKFLEMENALLKKFNELLKEEETKRK